MITCFRRCSISKSALFCHGLWSVTQESDIQRILLRGIQKPKNVPAQGVIFTLTICFSSWSRVISRAEHWSLKALAAFLLSSSMAARRSHSSNRRLTSSISRCSRFSWGSLGSPSWINFSESSLSALTIRKVSWIRGHLACYYILSF